MPVAQAAWPKQ